MTANAIQAVAYAAPRARGVRRALALTAVATLPFTAALTIDLKFPLKLYEVALVLAALSYVLDLRIVTAPGSRRLFGLLGLFLATATVITAFRIAFPGASMEVGSFATRFGPIGDAAAKLLYLTLAVIGLALFARLAYTDERAFLRAWLAGALFAAAYSWYHFLAGLAGIDPPLLPGSAEPRYFSVAGRTFIRSGTFQEGNFLGLYLLVSAGIALYARRMRAALVLTLTTFLTFSTINVLCLGLFWFLWGWRRQAGVPRIRRLLFVAMGALAMVALLAVLWQTGYIEAVVVGKLTGDESMSRLKRISFIIAGIAMFMDHPLTGVGLSQFGYYYNSYQTLGILGAARTVKLIPNNIYIELLSELGLAGVLILGAFLFGIYRRLRDPRLDALRVTLLTMLFAFNAFPTYSVMFLWAFFGLAIGASARLTHAARPA